MYNIKNKSINVAENDGDEFFVSKKWVGRLQSRSDTDLDSNHLSDQRFDSNPGKGRSGPWVGKPFNSYDVILI
jgi:hypothetical protein